MGTTKVIAAVLAAGSSSRILGEKPKQFQNFKVNSAGLLVSRNMVEVVCEKIGCVSEEILLAVNRNYISNSILPSSECGARVRVIEGGEKRMDTVLRCLESDVIRRCRADDIIIFHDAARPFVEVKYLEKLIKQIGLGYDAVLPVMQMYETIGKKYMQGGYESVDRNEYLIAETPEAYRVGFLRSLPDVSFEHHNSLFDIFGNPSFRKMFGWNVKFVPSSPMNKKVTLPGDMYGFRYYVEEQYGGEG